MSKRKTAIFLLSVLVALNATFFFLKKEVKADTVAPYTFVYSEKHIYEQKANSISESYIHQLEIFVSANHEMNGYYSFRIDLPTAINTSSLTNTKNYRVWAEGGQVDIVDDKDGNTILWFDVFVTGQKDLKVTIRQTAPNEIALFRNNHAPGFHGTDMNGNEILDTMSEYYHIQHMDDTTTQMYTELLNQGVTMYQISQHISNISSKIDNIDSLIDTISWVKYDDYLGINLDGNLFGTISKLTNNNKNAYIVFGTNNLAGNYDKLFKITINGQFTYTTEDKIKIYIQDQNYSIQELDSKYILYKYISRGMINIYIDPKFPITNFSNTRIAVYITDGAIVNPYAYNQIDMINNNDIEYWELLTYFIQNKYNNEQLNDNKTIIDKLTELINGNNRTQQSVNNNDQSTSQLNTQTEKYHQIESTYQSTFTTEQTEIKQQLNVNPLTSFSKTALWFTDQLTNLYNRSGNFKILFTLPLILGLAMYFIGRGRKVAAPNTVEHYTLVESAEAGEGRTVYKTTKSTARRRAFRDRSKT